MAEVEVDAPAMMALAHPTNMPACVWLDGWMGGWMDGWMDGWMQ